LAVKLAQLQVTDGSRLAAMAQANTIRHLVLEADRGIIYDRHGAPLVENSPVWSLVVVPAGLTPAARDRAEELVLLARLTGLEELLRGTDGWADVEVDARGQVKRVLETQTAVPGHAVYLSLDAALQRATAASLAAGLARDHKTAGASVVIDPRTGEVLAMIS